MNAQKHFSKAQEWLEAMNEEGKMADPVIACALAANSHLEMARFILQYGMHLE